MLRIAHHSSIRQRMLLAFSVLIAALVTASAVAAWRVQILNQKIQTLINIDVKALDLSRAWAGMSEGNIQRRIISITHNDPEFVEVFTQKSSAISKQVDEIQRQLGELPKDAKAKALNDRIDATRKDYQRVRDELIAQRKEGINILKRTQTDLLPKVDVYLGALQDFAEYCRERVESTEKAAMIAAERTTTLIVSMMSAAALLAVVMAVLLTRSIVRPLGLASAMAERIAQGDLSQDIAAEGRSELAVLAQRLSAMQQRLSDSISGVRGVAEQVRLASNEIATGNFDLSNRTEQAASSLEQTGAAMQQLREGVTTNAESAREANQLAHDTAQVAERGGDMVQQVVSTMRDIQQASHRIADIIGVIDGIAFQTNILALNAAVEAARAGEQGRGFAVVASEVRALAQRSAQAAKEIKGLIGASVDQVESGSRLVADTGSTITEVVRSVQSVSRVVAEISQATSAQAVTLGEIGQAIQQLDEMTQQNASLVEESAAAADGLRQRADELYGLVAVFQLRR
ncbi:methyl-accepting chemotaxis protein [Roseateles sp. BYS180W]|uniref:Methyl-accepting chemotaxis protein n=1 Tax=Roseateles rivi TaxID=3299028 RepID=A0ABW7FY91_9BURK